MKFGKYAWFAIPVFISHPHAFSLLSRSFSKWLVELKVGDWRSG